MLDPRPYTPQDQLTLWMLTDPVRPVRVGQLSLVLGGQGVALQYDPSWLAVGYALSEDLPLVDTLFMPAHKQEAAGAVDDARPDRWGERVMKKFERSPRLSLLEQLLFAGGDRYGALGVSQRADVYQPWPTSPMPLLGDLMTMHEVVRKVMANEPVSLLEQRLLRPGVSLGGARPKSLIEIEGEPWLVKFSEGEDEDTPLIEHAAMTLAARCGIQVATTRALPVGDRHAVAVRRFDRVGGHRIHVISARVALRAAHEEPGYPQFSQLLRRLLPAQDIAAAQAQLFRRMVFNILMDNTDDHEKNHALMRRTDGFWALSPAFDVVPSISGLGYQAMEIGREGTVSSLDNALSACASYGLKLPAARAVIHDVAQVIGGWQTHFRACGVRDSDIALLAQYLDGGVPGKLRRSVNSRP